MGRKKHTLDPQPRKRRAKYVMPVPNDDICDHGWALKNVRHAAKDDKTIAARPIFHVPLDRADLQKYGPDIMFMQPDYVEMQLDKAVGVKIALAAAAVDKYTGPALGGVTDAVTKAFAEHILIDVAERFYAVAEKVAQYMVAKHAHRQMFGSAPDAEETTPAAEPEPTED